MPLFCPLTRYGKTRRDVLFLQRFIRGYSLLLFFLKLFYEQHFFSKYYIYKLILFCIQTRLKYIFVRFLFQWPPGDVILPKTTTKAGNNQNWPTTRSILIYRWKELHRFYFRVHSIKIFTTFVKHFLICITMWILFSYTVYLHQ